MTEPNAPSSQGLILMIAVAAAILAIGVVVFSARALWQTVGRQPPARPATIESPEAKSSLAVAESAPWASPAPEVATPETRRRNLELDPHTMAIRQELSRQQAQAFRTIAKENTNLSFQLTEQEIQAMEKEGVRVQ